MPTRHADKIWTAGGVLGAAVLLALGWFFFIGPQYAEASSLDQQVVQAQLRLTAQQKKLAELRQQNEDLSQYKAQLERLRRALPSASASSDFLRDLQAAGERASVTVAGLTIGSRSEVPGTGGTMFALPVSLTVEGKVAGLEGFLTEVQQVQGRAALIRSTNLSADASGTALTLNMQIFVSASETGPAAKTTK
jgi:Tfp pilus assembly protein PilO